VKAARGLRPLCPTGDEVTTTWAYDGQFLLHRKPDTGFGVWTVAYRRRPKPPGSPRPQSGSLGTKINSSNLILSQNVNKILIGVTFNSTHSVAAGATMSIHAFKQPGAFEPEAIAVMIEVLETALKEVQDTRKLTRELIAVRIIAAATLGERDPIRLRAAALGSPRRERD